MKKTTALALLAAWSLSIPQNSWSATLPAAQTTSPTGFTTTQTQQAAQTSQNLVDSQNALLAAVSGTQTATVATTPAPVLSDPYGQYLSWAILATAEKQNDFNLLYGTTIGWSGATTANDINIVNAVAAEVGVDRTGFLASVNRAANLLRALQANTTQRTAYNTAYTATLQASGTPTSASLTTLYTAVNKAGYDQAAFLASLAGNPPPPPPVLTGQLFSPTSFWNTKNAQSRTVSAKSANYVASIVADTMIASPWIDTGEYSTPLYNVNSSTPKVPVYIVQNGVTMTSTALNAETTKGVPIPTNLIPASGADGHVTIYDTSTDTIYEFWQMQQVNGKWQASWGGILKNASTSDGTMPTVTNPAGGQEFWGATATSLPAIAGTIMLKELQSGVIPHALAFAMINPGNTFVPPAKRTDGPSSSSSAPPEGTTFRLPANTVIDPNWSPLIKMIAIAARDYGIVLRDTAGAVKFYMEDATQYGGESVYDPYFGGLELWDVVDQFPWDKLQALNP